MSSLKNQIYALIISGCAFIVMCSGLVIKRVFIPQYGISDAINFGLIGSGMAFTFIFSLLAIFVRK